MQRNIFEQFYINNWNHEIMFSVNVSLYFVRIVIIKFINSNAVNLEYLVNVLNKFY
jgi:hypothetical protein